MSDAPYTSTPEPITLLVVDDSPIFLSAIRHFFEVRPRFVILAAVQTGDEALRLPLEPSPLVVLLDLQFANRLRIELIAPLKQKWPRTKIVVLTFNAVEQYRELALRAGADEFVSKLYVTTDLVPAIERALRAE